MENKKISIILPVYNGEDIIEKCIKSILNQTYENFELIIINDASSDNTTNIINEISKKDSRIKIIHNKKNSGVSKSRNLGIEEATGEYITFIDSDDFYEKNALEIMHKLITEHDVDALRFAYNICSNNTEKRLYSEKYTNKLYNKNNISEFIKDILSNDLQGYLWLIILKSQYAKEVKFNESLGMMEDTVWYIEILNKIDTIYFTNEVLYNYTNNIDSASHSLEKSKRNIENVLLINKIYNDFYKNEQYKTIYSTGLIGVLLENVYKFALSKESSQEKKIYLKTLKDNADYIDILKNANLKEIRADRRILVYLINNKLTFFLILYCKLKENFKRILKNRL